ncbi:MAG TPA: GNAT family N-acetyltransferase [Candidatus Acidoferrum sp.]|nr:GNAT family N-acetyltransferase [Candidatus Acidoferrum sp.]
MLETQRLRLAPWQADDWLELKPIAQDPEVMRYISSGQPWPEERIREFVARQIACHGARSYCLWRLLLKDTGAMIGFCGLQPLDGTPEIEIGWWLDRAWWGQGLATEAAREAMKDGFERAALERIVAIAQPENRASIHVMEKLGMRFERETTHKGFPVVLYAIPRAPSS